MKKRNLHFNKLIGLFMTFTMLLFLSGNTFAQKKQTTNVLGKKIVQNERTIDKSKTLELITKADRHSRTIKPNNFVSNKAAMLYEGFDGGVFPPAGWTIDVISGDPSNLIFDETNPLVGTGSAYWSGYGSGTASPQESRLISPMVNVAIPAILTYVEWVKYVGACETYVEISEDKTNWTTIYTPTADVFKETNIVIPESYYGKDVYFAFHYIDTNLWEYGEPVTYWEIDEVNLHGFTGTEILDLSFGDDQKGETTVDAEKHIVTANVYKSTDLTSFATDFTLSVGAKLSPAAEWYDAEGDIIPHDFTDTVEVNVLSGDGEQTQLWKIKADKLDEFYTGNELSNFNFGSYQVGEVWYDNYARRVEAKVLFDSTLNIAPTFEFSERATVTPALGEIVDFTNPVNYTVVSESGDELTYRVTVTNAAAEKDADIYAFSVENQAANAVVVDNTILAYVNNDKPLNSLNVTIITSPFASMVSPTTADFEAGPVIYKVVAEDETVTIDWSVRLVCEDTLLPVVTAMYNNLDTLTNVGDSTKIEISESPSNVALVLEGQVFADMDALDDLVYDYKATYTEIEKGKSIGTIYTDGLKVGNYLAYAIDSTGNISDPAEDTLVVTIGTKEVATIADLWATKNYNMQYKLTGEAIISKIVGFKGRIHIQDATAGILFEDYNEDIVTTEYDRYDGITGLTGTLYNSHGTLKFEAVSDPGVASSTGNTIEPKLITLQEFEDNQEDYQSQVIKINNVNVTSTGVFENGKNYDIGDYTSDEGVLRSHFYNVDYIGTDIPDTIVNVVGVAVYDYNVAKIAPRDAADITGVEGSELFTMDYDFEEVLVGDTARETLYYGNIGNGIITIDSVRFKADMSVFSFKQVTPSTSQVSYEADSVMVTFNPDSAKDETASIIYYYDTDKTHTSTITGTGYANPVWTVGSLESFEKDGYEEGDVYTGSDLPDFPPAGWKIYKDNSGFMWDQGWYGGNNQNGTNAHSGELAAYLKYGSGIFETPEIDLTGDDVKFPAIEFWAGNTFQKWDDFYVGVSTDNSLPMNQWDRYEIPNNPGLENGVMAKNAIQLSNYNGQHVWVRFYAKATSGLYLYQFIDDVSIIEFPVTPVYAVNADPFAFGVTNTDVAIKQTFKISNQGVSYITVDTAYVIGTNADLFAIPADLTFGEESYDASVMSFDITFTPTTIGEKTAKLVIKYSDARNANVMDTVELSGYGVNCANALEAVIGTNNAPYAPSWYKFTPTKNCVISVLANTKEDTYLKVYDACGGTMISDNDDVSGTSHEVNADYTAASAADFYGEADHTYYIYWTEDNGGNGSFDFSITVNEEEGAICETAKEVTLPMYGDVEFSGSTVLTGDFYDDNADLCDAHYLGGNDFVYTFTIEEPVLLSGSIDNAYAGMHIVTKPIGLFGAAAESNARCAAFAYFDTKSQSFSNKRFEAGTYYAVVSTWPKPQTIDFTIHFTTKSVPRANVIFNVDMTYAVKRGDFDATKDSVDVAGSINAWAGEKMTDTDADGIYTITYNDVVIGETIEYKYRINGDWATSEFPNGGPNREYTILEGDNILNNIYDDNTDVGVNELSLFERIEVYPNPNTGRFMISINSNNSENIVVELVNIQGQKVYRNEMKNVTNSVENIDISEFAKGIYYIRVNNGTDVAIRKVVVQ
ncbi:MAG: T9SS type A sorting domain-containing protein [Bacteroidetes bacterium]|nr:T9SS type A sorting domain-containing protein [Bacteroidota bacterium]